MKLEKNVWTNSLEYKIFIFFFNKKEYPAAQVWISDTDVEYTGMVISEKNVFIINAQVTNMKH